MEIKYVYTDGACQAPVGSCNVFDIVEDRGRRFMLISKNENTATLALIDGESKGCQTVFLNNAEVLLLKTELTVSIQSWGAHIASFPNVSEEQIEEAISLSRPAP